RIWLRVGLVRVGLVSVGLSVGPRIGGLVLNAAQSDCAVVGGVTADAVARVLGLAGNQAQRLVVALDGRAVVATQKLEIARQIVSARPQLDGLRSIQRDQSHDSQRTFHL